jgi:hypothetical protein
MIRKLGWITPFAALAVALVGCGGAPGDEGNATNEAMAQPGENNAEAAHATAPASAEPNAGTNVGKNESAWLGYGYGYPYYGYGAYGAGYAGYAAYGMGYGYPGFYGYGYYPGFAYGACGVGLGCGGYGYGWGFKDGEKVAAPGPVENGIQPVPEKVDVAKAEVQK